MNEKIFYLYVSMISTLRNLATILYVYRACSFCESNINLYNHCLQTLHSHLLICNLIYNYGNDMHLHIWRKEKPDRSDNLNPQLYHHENLKFCRTDWNWIEHVSYRFVGMWGLRGRIHMLKAYISRLSRSSACFYIFVSYLKTV